MLFRSNQLTYAVDNLASVKVNAEASRSRILDTDYAQETSELARTQIIQQAGTAMLAQANQLWSLRDMSAALDEMVSALGQVAPQDQL